MHLIGIKEATNSLTNLLAGKLVVSKMHVISRFVGHCSGPQNPFLCDRKLQYPEVTIGI